MIPKFRAWDKKAKEMLEIESIDFVNETLFLRRESEFSMSWVELNFNDVALMQTTGLKDRNGKEIFEGDIVENDYGEKGYIKLTEHGLVFVKRIDTKENAYYTHGIGAGSPFEIIGNIHEHPGLLEGMASE